MKGLFVALAVIAAIQAVNCRKKLKPERRQSNSYVWYSPMDVEFIIDSSDRVGRTNFRSAMAYVQNLVRHWNIGPQYTRVGLVTYSNGVQNQFFLNSHLSQSQVIGALGNVKFQGGPSDAGNAFQFVSQTGFSPLHGSRQNVPHVIIHIGGNPSSNKGFTIQEAQRAKDNGAIVYNVAVGNGLDMDEVRRVASQPTSRYVLTSDNYQSLDSLVNTMSTRVRSEVPSTQTSFPAPSSCLQKADLVFLVDSSSSIGSGDFQHLVEFLKDVAVQLPIGPNNVQMGVLQYGSHPSLTFPLNMYTNRLDVLKAIQNMNYFGGATNTADALKYMREHVFSLDSGARANVPRIAIVITDGHSSNPSQTTTEADNARLSQIGLIGVGVGSGLDINELHNIAGTGNTITVRSYDDLKSAANQIMTAACGVHNVLTPTSSSHAGASTCTDKLANCNSYQPTVCTEYKSWALENCAAHCQLCTGFVTKPPAPCKDAIQNCNMYAPDMCKSFGQWAKEKCAKFCGFCDGTTDGFYGKCFYKNKAYSHGEKWTDGCDYECVCENGQTGSYRCYNKCPIYNNLPTACTLVAKPGECCLQPVCNFHQNVQITEGSGLGKTASGINVCEYGGKQYYQDQSWEVGCDFKCTCFNANSGAYRCQSYCPVYSGLPSTCKLVKSPGSCCAKPSCNFNLQVGSFTGTGSISSAGSISGPTQPPPCQDVLGNCASYSKASCSEKFLNWAHTNCRKYCNLCDEHPTPAPSDVCIYHGVQYHQGVSWRDGCDKECTCEQATYGYYRCVNRCPSYNNLPAGCYSTKKSGDCCETVQCNRGTFIPSSTNLMSIGNGGGMSVTGPGGQTISVSPTLPSGGTPPPGSGGTGMQAPQLHGCLFKGQLYVKNQQWADGCAQICVCVDETTGMYQCRSRCPDYQGVPAGCGRVADPNDMCCTLPHCPQLGYVPIPYYPQGVQNIGAVKPPSYTDLISGTFKFVNTINFSGGTVAPPTAPLVTSGGGIGYCEYKGQRHMQSEKWEDGCKYNCVCEDASTGFWRCVEKCRQYNNLPPKYCWLIPDPSNSCCKVPHCVFPSQVIDLIGTLTQPPYTVPIQTSPQPTHFLPSTPRPAYCDYKGQHYSQGQVWYDGCSSKCQCDNAQMGVYRCTQRCPEYKNIPTVGCTLVPDPMDPACCKVPQCHFTPTSGSATGHGIPPTLPPGSFVNQPNPRPIGHCEYKGQTYQQGVKWTDGCQYSCICEDAIHGQYRCTELCPRYPPMPAGCFMKPDFANQCCKKPDCSFIGTSGQISGQGQLTPAPHINTPKPGSTGVPKPSYCVYKGVNYYQGQTWQDGCNKDCRCEDSQNGLYTCNNRCPTYPSLPSQCHMVTDPKDQCCQIPSCQFPSSQGQITGTLAPDLIPTAVPGVISGTAKVPVPTPGPNGQIPTPLKIDFCVYKGVQYHQGEKWDDGCDYTCQCEDQSTGKYVCKQKCAKYPNLPAQCRLNKDPANPCCSVPSCIFTPTNTGITGQATPKPGATPNTGINPTPRPKDVCVYRGQSYSQGQTWYDGCDYKCVCEDGSGGVYRCNNRCPSYKSIPKECTFVADPQDPFCCRVPKCHFNPSQGQITGHGIPTLPPGQITGGSATPAPTPGSNPSPHPGATPAYKNVCVYQGKTYQQGQKWQDGCDYDCECINSMEGKYKCLEKCPKYPKLPAQCHMQRDAYNPCCYKPVCDFTGTSGQVTGKPPVTKPPPVCIYNGVPYKQGETWNDGCQLKCSCEDAKTNIYRCDTRCAQYPMYPGCTLVLDPRDSCCSIPSCPTVAPPTLPPGQTPRPGQQPTPQPIPTLAPGIIHGQTVNNVTQKTCLYHGVVYHQGQKWDDGCRYKCECIDEHSGKYVCHERCSQYPNVPSYCTMGVDPSDQCCKKPQCNPLPVVTPVPNPQHTVNPSPGLHNTPAPQPRNYCEYKNARYVQGQQWFDGCDKTCICDDGKTGFYRCSDRCAKYPSIPAQCTMVADPKDPQCCQVPQCLPTPGPGGFPTPLPGQTIAPEIVTNVPGVITGKPPTPTPGPDGKTPPPRKVCVYNGKEYHQGQRWQDGCKYNCICENEVTGSYKCEERCANYPFVPPTCKLIRDTSDYCCFKMSCVNQPTPNPYQTPAPGSSVTPNPHPQNTPSPNYCVYQGIPYRQGQVWNVGCSQKCRCDDASKNYYTCYDRCATHQQTPGCTLVVDPNDACCRIPLCSPTPSPNTFPSPGPGQSPQPHPYPVPQPTIVPPGTIGGGKPNPNPLTNQGFCEYKGRQYKQGDKWQDGCDYNCVCIDDSTGQYTCTEKCSKIISIPSFCTLIQDPYDVCCKKPSCPSVNPTPNQTPAPGLTTPTPPQTPAPQPREVCIYMGLPYTQGQQWYDGCDKKCICADGKTGFYTCSDRCAKYTNIAPSCIMVPDPTDPICCQAPKCSSPTGKPPVGITGSITGIGKPPTPTPNIAPTPLPGQTYPPFFSPTPGTTAKPNPVCVYKGTSYAEGQRWADGCEYDCVCIDGMEGKYRCSEKCPKYPNLPATCRMVYDSTNPCCYKPDCTQQTPHPGPYITPLPGHQQTPSPLDVCVYNGVPFHQGQSWKDGCSKTCRCEDSMTGLVNCDDRCPTYPQLKPGCYLITDPSDACCQVPKCTTPSNNQHHTLPGIPGTIHGSSLPTNNQSPNTRNNVCIYHGRSYQQGQTWEDGCEYTCECIDSMSGKYRCNEKCAPYPSVPSTCSMVKDPNNQCCMVPYCPSLSPTNTVPHHSPPQFTPSPGATFPPYFTPAPHKTFPPQQTLPPGFSPVPGGPLPHNLTPQPGKTYAPYLTFPPLFTPYPGVTFPYFFTPAPGKTFAPSMTLPPGLVPIPGETLPRQLTPKPGQTYPPSVTFPFIPGPTLPPNLTPAPGKTYAPNLTLPPQFVPTPGATLPPGLTPAPGKTYPPGFTFPTPGRPLPSGLTPSPGRTYAPNLTLPPGLVPTPGMTMPSYFTPAPGKTFPPGFTFPTPPGHPLPPQLTPAPGKTYAPSITLPYNVVPTPGQTLPPYVTPHPGQTFPPGFTYPTPPGHPIPSQLTPAPGKTYAPSVTLPYNIVPKPGQTLPPNITPHPGQTFPPGFTYPTPPGHPIPSQLTPAPGKTYAPSVTLPYYIVPKPGQTLPPNITPHPGQTFPPGFTYPTPTGRPLPPQLTPAPGKTYAPSVTLPYNMVPTPGQTLPPYITPHPGQTFPPGFTYPTPTPTGQTLPPQLTPAPGKTYAPSVTLPPGFIPTPGKPLPPYITPVPGQTFPPSFTYPTPPGHPLPPGLTPTPGQTYAPSVTLPYYIVPKPGGTLPPNITPQPGKTFPPSFTYPVPPGHPLPPQLTPAPGKTYAPSITLPYNIAPKPGQTLPPYITPRPGQTFPPSFTYPVPPGHPIPPQLTPAPGKTYAPSITLPYNLVPTPGQTLPPYITPLPGQTFPQGFTYPTPTGRPLPPQLTPAPGQTYGPHVTLPHNFVPTPGQTLPPYLTPLPGQTFPAGFTFPTPTPHVKGFCVYKNAYYREKQTWYDGCNAMCECESGDTGNYRCQERCATFNKVAPECTLIPDPKDPACCMVPSCPVKPVGPAPTPGYLQVTGNHGQVTGLAPVPTPNPYATPAPGGQTPAPNPYATPRPKTGCVYKGIVHRKGETWDDGCQYTCACLDDMTGQYKCTEKCVRVPKPPSQCVMMQDPKNPCCKIPYCDFLNPTPFPGGLPTPNPHLNPTLAPGQTPTPYNPTQGYCVYKGSFYQQGQKWNDGCSQTCICDDTTTGHYTCKQRCSSYPFPPAGCVFRTDPSDACCLVPDCSKTPLIPVFPGTGTGPSGTKLPAWATKGPGISGTRPPYVVPPGLPGTFTGMGVNPIPGGSISGYAGVCLYNKKMYNQGEKWEDGCKYKCECIDQLRGKYRCTDRCPQHYFLPPQCFKVTSTKDACCSEVHCNPAAFPTPAPGTYVTPTPGINPNTMTAQPFTNKPYTPAIVTGPSGTKPPMPDSTYNTFTGTKPPNVCRYKDGTMHRQGETWTDGCDYICECKNPLTNDYKCEQRCPTYTSIPPFCQLTPDPADICCKKPVCSYNGQTLVPMLGNPKHPPLTPYLSPSVTNVVPLGTHQVISGTGIPPGQAIHYGQGHRSGCVYKGVIHQPGESWDDGCKFTCTCKDSEDGQYECISKCPTYPAIPSYCKFIDVAGQCCPSLSCNLPGVGKYNPVPMVVPTPVPNAKPGQSPNLVPTPGAVQAPQIILGPGQTGVVGGSGLPGHGAPVPSGTTIGGINDKCIYKNKMYNQGERWDDLCDYQCECIEARSGFYKCIPKCAKYDTASLSKQGCYLVTNPNTCCQKPMCRKPDGSIVNPVTQPGVYPIVGSFTGGFTGFRPGYVPGTGLITNGRTPGCVYNGHLYHRGDTWTDGCKYDCSCLDNNQGQYQCHPKCPQYTQLPPACKFVQPPQGQCCSKVTCNIVTTPVPVHTTAVHVTGPCKDVLPNCASFGPNSCKAPYIDWAKTNCPAYCNYCPTPTPTVNSHGSGCVDLLPNCAAYGQSACAGKFNAWAVKNCQRYCNLCPTPASSACKDVLPNCNSYGPSSCTGLYLKWAKANCAKTCHMCPGQATSAAPVGLGIPPQGWTILMKGVAGAPGDLFSLWASPNTQNEHVPAAQLMTAQFPQHYKPDLSNHWSECHFDKVMVGIYKNGVEKANIIFDARNSDKMNWFRPERIISSTWTDIRYAPSNIFRLSGDPSTGREFYASSSGFGCDVNGWFMISTRSGCNFEPSSSKKPAFYYVKGNQKGKFTQGSLGSGDVFAILAQGGNCDGTHPVTPTSFTQTSNVCIYKNKFYHEHETWQDGCEFNCTCEDAKTGFYRCSELCPHYNQVPVGCKLTKNPGECCEKLDCINNGNFCYYKNKYYTQGQSWNDGCDYRCKCVDATKGFYQCKTRCLTWNLPKVCTLDPPKPGMCCKTPNCPSGIVINYPPNYVAS